MVRQRSPQGFSVQTAGKALIALPEQSLKFLRKLDSCNKTGVSALGAVVRAWSPGCWARFWRSLLFTRVTGARSLLFTRVDRSALQCCSGNMALSEVTPTRVFSLSNCANEFLYHVCEWTNVIQFSTYHGSSLLSAKLCKWISWSVCVIERDSIGFNGQQKF